MLGVEEITKYRASDGTEFEEEEKAFAYEIGLVTKKINPEDIIVKNRFGNILYLKDLWWTIDSAFYAEIKSEVALDFFNEASESMGTQTLESIGTYRYCEVRDKWISIQEDFQEFLQEWKIYNKNINFTLS